MADDDIPDGLKLYRRINPAVHLVKDSNLDCLRVSTSAFKQIEMSVVWDDTLRQSGRVPSDATTPTESHLVWFTAGAIRGLDDIKTVRSPQPLECAHGDVIGAKTKSLKRELVRVAQWEQPPTRPEGSCDPPGGSY